jgi:hypothetical protein
VGEEGPPSGQGDGERFKGILILCWQAHWAGRLQRAPLSGISQVGYVDWHLVDTSL